MGRSRRIPEVEFDLSATTPGPWAIGPGMYTYTGGTSYDDDGMKAAVNLWCSDREAAELKHGNISQWNTSAVTDMLI